MVDTKQHIGALSEGLLRGHMAAVMYRDIMHAHKEGHVFDRDFYEHQEALGQEWCTAIEQARATLRGNGNE